MNKNKIYLNYFLFIGIILSLIFIIVSYTNHIQLFTKNPHIIIKGIDYINKQEILTKINPDELKIFTNGIKKTQKNIEKINYVKSVKISFLLPNIYVIQIIEREPIFMVTNNEYSKFYDIHGESLDVNGRSVNHFPVPIISYDKNLFELIDKQKPLQLITWIIDNNINLYNNVSEIIFNDSQIEIITDSLTKILINKSLFKKELQILNSFENTISHVKSISDYKYIDLTVSNKVIIKEKKHG